jgi:hypothetical protein
MSKKREKKKEEERGQVDRYLHKGGDDGHEKDHQNLHYTRVAMGRIVKNAQQNGRHSVIKHKVAMGDKVQKQRHFVEKNSDGKGVSGIQNSVEIMRPEIVSHVAIRMANQNKEPRNWGQPLTSTLQSTRWIPQSSAKDGKT